MNQITLAFLILQALYFIGIGLKTKVDGLVSYRAWLVCLVIGLANAGMAGLVWSQD